MSDRSKTSSVDRERGGELVVAALLDRALRSGELQKVERGDRAEQSGVSVAAAVTAART